jgi:4-amino-4-deoxy-L-arabinose transferase-like glycosyltransferase
MARSGDWITPRLWGEPWFEKPALLYWLIALGNIAGLGPELAPRLPVALVSIAFLVFYQRILAREFGSRAAWFATAVLGTSAGWLGFSHAATTDLPMSAAFASAMLLSLAWRRTELVIAGVLMGLAVLGKGLVPLVLAVPVLWYGRRRLLDLAWPAAACLLTCIPWYALMIVRHDGAFIDEFFWRHHFGRFGTDELQHVQPFWYYLPVLIGAFFPWSPALMLLFQRRIYSDERRLFLVVWLLFGLLFFSASTNKLPGYLLPLLPAAAALLGIALSEAVRLRWLLAGCALLLALLPAIGSILPQALEEGLTRADWSLGPWPVAILFAVHALLTSRLSRPERAAAAIVAGVVAGVLYLKLTALPMVDAAASARPLSRRGAGKICPEQFPRSIRYGLNYYLGAPLTECTPPERPDPAE